MIYKHLLAICYEILVLSTQMRRFAYDMMCCEEFTVRWAPWRWCQ